MSVVLKRISCNKFLGNNFSKFFKVSYSHQSDVIFSEVNKAGVITLNRPQVLNVLTRSMINEIYSKLKEWETEQNFVLIKGAGDRAFCAGGDLLHLAKARNSVEKWTKPFIKEACSLYCLVNTYHIPFIALINGITMGAGAGVSVNGQYRVATEKTVFSMPENKIGLFNDVGSTYFLPRLGGHLGIFLGLTGYKLKGVDNVMGGIATNFCDSDKIENLEEELLSAGAIYPEDVSNVLLEYSQKSVQNKNRTFSLQPYLQKINECFKEDSVEQIMKKLEEDGSEFSKKQIELMLRMSPTSLKVSLEGFRRGQNATIQECLAVECRLSQRCTKHIDFYEGVRALLIDKDLNPSWTPSTLEEVSRDRILNYFAVLPDEDELIL